MIYIRISSEVFKVTLSLAATQNPSELVYNYGMVSHGAVGMLTYLKPSPFSLLKGSYFDLFRRFAVKVLHLP